MMCFIFALSRNFSSVIRRMMKNRVFWGCYAVWIVTDVSEDRGMFICKLL
jgi:hypothetical protein